MSSDLQPDRTWDAEATWRTFEDDTFHTEIQGIELQKCEQDLDRYREVIDASQPDIVVETGTRAGGSALWFKEQGLQVISIDLAPQWRQPPYVGPGIEWIRGSSINLSIVGEVLPMIQGKRVMVSLDSDHHSGHVQSEIALWSQLVSPGCYLVVEDACFDLFEPEKAQRGGTYIPAYGGALDAIRKCHMPVLEARHFWRDIYVERMDRVSHSPVGWWRRSE